MLSPGAITPFSFRNFSMTPQEELALIREKLGHLTLNRKVRHYLDTGSEELNAVLGNPDKGIRYDTLSEFHGMESQGKSLLAYILAGLAQKDGARVIWVDAENSWDRTWARRWLDTKAVVVIRPYVGSFKRKSKKEKKAQSQTKAAQSPSARMASAEELTAEAQALVEYWRAQDLKKGATTKVLLVVDSITALMTRDEEEAGIEGQNMNTNTSLARFLSKLMRRWVALAHTHNCFVVFINQLRLQPGVTFANPEYTPGGKAAKFYCHNRVRVRRIKGGRMRHSGKTIGIKGVITNVKNKLGGVEGSEVGFKIKFDGTYEFVSAAALKKEEKEV